MGFHSSFLKGYFRLGYVNVNDCPAGLEPAAGARIRRKATVKISRNQQLRFLYMILKLWEPLLFTVPCPLPPLLLPR